MDQILAEDLPLPGPDDSDVVLAVDVGDLGGEQVMIGAPVQTAACLGDSFNRRVGQDETAVEVLGVDEDVGVLEYDVEHSLLLPQRRVGCHSCLHFGSEPSGMATQLKLADHLGGQDLQVRALKFCQRPRFAAQDTQRPKDVAIGGDQRRAGVEAQVRFTRDQWIVDEACVEPGIGHHQQVGAAHYVSAERLLPRCLGHAQSMPGLEPLPVRVHQAHQCHGRTRTGAPRAPARVIEGRFRGSVHDRELRQRQQPTLLYLLFDGSL